MAVGMMELLGALTQGGMSPSSGARIQNAANASADAQGGGLSGILSGLMGAGQNLVNSAGQAVGGKDNLAAAGIGALLGALSGAGNGRSGVPLGGIGGGVMGLLGMMAFKALKNAGQAPQPSAGPAASPAGAAPQNFESDAHLLLTAMLDAAKADGTVDADELNRITGKMKEAGIDQEGMTYVIGQLQSPMATDAIVAGVQGRPDLAAQVYSVSLMAIEVDTPAERAYLDRLAASMGLAPEVAQNIEQLVGMPPR